VSLWQHIRLTLNSWVHLVDWLSAALLVQNRPPQLLHERCTTALSMPTYTRGLPVWATQPNADTVMCAV
jgi:hypothetical protein